MILLKIVQRFCKLIFGLFLYALGIVLTIKANIGYGPWEVFHVGLGNTVGISIGNASILVGLALVVITLLMGEKVGFGTILNMILIGVFLDLILMSNLIGIVDHFYWGILVLVLGLYTISLGSFFYIDSGFGAGPRDGLMVALKRKFTLPIGVIRSIIELTATTIGWFLGGMVGVGTLISVVMIGFCVQSTFGILKFDPTKVTHSTLNESYQELKLALRLRNNT
ncbi:hypothetical protein EXM22_01555 [Oceanispirochaeta crateris]|uniref:YitT family protein n=1 Tax=Oceanispirochaeta crateris TaxID=2518645 RepID=A0A5C1QHZ6_9SPIO|nr:hypothetical protein [Oceanispirochaeta crateris]QEN06739.1 hypothetical protein EXM22_01555 [Oceanispirochaeta crateris]